MHDEIATIPTHKTEEAMTDLYGLLGEEATDLLGHVCQGIPRSLLHLPGPDFVERVMMDTDRKPGVLRGFASLLDHGRLGGTGYLSILPVDQGVEHSGGASFAPNPLFFDPENIVRLAMDGGCNAVASTLGVLGSVGRRYAHKIPFLAATIEADIVKQKQATNNNGYTAIAFGKTHPKVYSELTSPHPIDLVRYQVANCFMGRAGMINSGGASGENDLAQAVRTAVINKRAGGMGLISGRKAFQKSMAEGVRLLNAIQDVYLSPEVTIA
jgi:DhnA family fructose-bisphosphate aldolase class Ia